MVQTTTVPAKTSLYDTDYYAWIEQQVALLQTGQTNAIDWINLAEEVADMGRSQKQAVTSNLVVVITHLLKYHYQPEQRSNNWLGSIREHRRRLRDMFEIALVCVAMPKQYSLKLIVMPASRLPMRLAFRSLYFLKTIPTASNRHSIRRFYRAEWPEATISER